MSQKDTTFDITKEAATVALLWCVIVGAACLIVMALSRNIIVPNNAPQSLSKESSRALKVTVIATVKKYDATVKACKLQGFDLLAKTNKVISIRDVEKYVNACTDRATIAYEDEIGKILKGIK